MLFLSLSRLLSIWLLSTIPPSENRTLTIIFSFAQRQCDGRLHALCNRASVSKSLEPFYWLKYTLLSMLWMKYWPAALNCVGHLLQYFPFHCQCMVSIILIFDLCTLPNQSTFHSSVFFSSFSVLNFFHAKAMKICSSLTKKHFLSCSIQIKFFSFFSPSCECHSIKWPIHGQGNSFVYINFRRKKAWNQYMKSLKIYIKITTEIEISFKKCQWNTGLPNRDRFLFCFVLPHS